MNLQHIVKTLRDEHQLLCDAIVSLERLAGTQRRRRAAPRGEVTRMRDRAGTDDGQAAQSTLVAPAEESDEMSYSIELHQLYRQATATASDAA
jgi:hypothetical protein